MLLFLMLLPFVGFSQNYAINPTFVDGLDWSNANAGTGQGIVSPADSHTADGSTSYKIVSNGSFNSQIRNSNISGLEAGDYIFGYWVKGASGVNTLPQIRDNNSNENGSAYTIIDTNTWEYVEQTFSVSGLGNVSLRLFIKNDNAGTAIQVDDVTFVKEGCTGSTITTAVDAPGGGTSSITDPQGCYADGTTVVVTPVACDGFAFDKWEIDVNGTVTESTDNPLNYIAPPNAVVEIKAIFVAIAAVSDTNFNTTAELNNWAGIGNSSAVVAADDLTWSITGDTPKLRYNACSFAPETWGTSHLKIGYSNQTSNTRLKLAIPTAAGTTAYIDFDGLTIGTPEEPGVEVLNIPIRNANWTGSLTQLDFIIKLNSDNDAAATGDFVIDYIEFYNGFETTENGNWSTAATWVGNYVPTALDNVQINHNISISATTAAVAKTVIVATSKTLTIDETSSLTVSGDFTNSGTVTLNSTADDFSSLIVEGTASGDIIYNRFVNVYDDSMVVVGI